MPVPYSSAASLLRGNNGWVGNYSFKNFDGRIDIPLAIYQGAAYTKLESNTGQKATKISNSGGLLVEYALDVSERPVFTDLSVSAGGTNLQ